MTTESCSGGTVFTQESALAFLRAAHLFYWNEPDEDEKDEPYPSHRQLNMNDTWGWALAWGEYVPDEKLIEVAELVRRYGWCGALYWVSEQHGGVRSEFKDINRFVDFVRREEQLRMAEPDPSKRAYANIRYWLGSEQP